MVVGLTVWPSVVALGLGSTRLKNYMNSGPKAAGLITFSNWLN